MFIVTQAKYEELEKKHKALEVEHSKLKQSFETATRERDEFHKQRDGWVGKANEHERRVEAEIDAHQRTRQHMARVNETHQEAVRKHVDQVKNLAAERDAKHAMMLDAEAHAEAEQKSHDDTRHLLADVNAQLAAAVSAHREIETQQARIRREAETNLRRATDAAEARERILLSEIEGLKARSSAS